MIAIQWYWPIDDQWIITIVPRIIDFHRFSSIFVCMFSRSSFNSCKVSDQDTHREREVTLGILTPDDVVVKLPWMTILLKLETIFPQERKGEIKKRGQHPQRLWPQHRFGDFTKNRFQWRQCFRFIPLIQLFGSGPAISNWYVQLFSVCFRKSCLIFEWPTMPLNGRVQNLNPRRPSFGPGPYTLYFQNSNPKIVKMVK